MLSTAARLRKDNTGYDLKQLFIGAEGTLGVVTAATLKLFPQPRSSALALLELHDVEQALQIMQRLRGAVGDRLGSLEIMSTRARSRRSLQTVPHVAVPFELTHAVVPDRRTDRHAGRDRPQRPLAADAFGRDGCGLADDAVLASSIAQAEAIGRSRHSVSEGNKRSGHVVSHDSVVPLDGRPRSSTNVEARIMAVFPDARVVMHGHIGDGNIFTWLPDRPRRCSDPAATAALVR